MLRGPASSKVAAQAWQTLAETRVKFVSPHISTYLTPPRERKAKAYHGEDLVPAASDAVAWEVALLNRPLVVAVMTRTMSPMFADAAGREDLIQEGLLALHAAAKDYDPARGSWSNHAWRRVWAALWRYLESTNVERKGHRAPPQLRELAVGLLHDEQPDVQRVEDLAIGEAGADLLLARAGLTAREAEVVRLRVLEGRSLREAGKLIGLSYESVRTIEAGALDKLRRAALEMGLEEEA